MARIASASRRRLAVPRVGVTAVALWTIASLAPAAQQVVGQNVFRERTIVRVERGDWTGARLPDGQPDVEGHWSNTIGNHNNLTGARGPVPDGGDGPPTGRGRGEGGGNGGGPGGGRRGGGAPLSRITDPADGTMPLQPWAREKHLEFWAHLNNPTRPEYVEPFARCAPGGPTKSFMWHGYEIRQYPGYIVFLFDSGNRVIRLDGSPHLPENIKLWNGDSRGRWEGNTLVVSVRNNNSKWRFGRSGEFVSENATIEERFIFGSDGGRFLYEATYTDPTVLTRPFAISIPNKRITADTPVDDWNNLTFRAVHAGSEPILEVWERICAEGNAAHGDVALEGQ